MEWDPGNMNAVDVYHYLKGGGDIGNVRDSRFGGFFDPSHVGRRDFNEGTMDLPAAPAPAAPPAGYTPPGQGGGGGFQWPGQGGGEAPRYDWTQGTPPAQYFQAYSPGAGSPWGNPNFEGDNRSFYAQQFSNLLAGDQHLRNQAVAAALRGQAAEQNRQEQGPFDFTAMWESMGLRPSTGAPGGGAGAPPTGGQGGAPGAPSDSRWVLREGITPGKTTAKEITDLLGSQGILNKQEMDIFQKHWDNPNANPDDTTWGSAPDYETLVGRIEDSLSGGFHDALTKAFRNIWVDSSVAPPSGGGAFAPPGYVAPGSGMRG